MPRNMEIKARVNDLAGLTEKARALANDAGTLSEQEDTFFNVPSGRLKLRSYVGQPGFLIHYHREDKQGPKLSHYDIVQVDDVEAMKTILSAALGVRGKVKKSRLLIMLGQTRIHLDDVDGLGQFMELEVTLHEHQTEEEGQLIAQSIMDSLEISKDDLLDCAYMDLILKT